MTDTISINTDAQGRVLPSVASIRGRRLLRRYGYMELKNVWLI